MNIINYLSKLGLNDKEISVYLVSLKLGESRISAIVRETEFPKTTVYHILESLRKKNLIEILKRNSRYVYIPYSPRKILTLYRNKQEKLKEEIENLELVLPEMNQIYSHLPFQPKVRFFRGQKELRQIYEELVNSPISEGIYVGETDKIVKVLGEKYLKDWVRRRVANGIRSRSVRIKSAEPESDILSKAEGYRRSIRYAPEDFKCPTHILIYGNNVAIMTTSEENFGLVITSQEFASTMRNWFKQLWKLST